MFRKAKPVNRLCPISDLNYVFNLTKKATKVSKEKNYKFFFNTIKEKEQVLNFKQSKYINIQ